MHRIPQLFSEIEKRNSLVGLAIVGANKRFLQVNNRLPEILGYSKQDLLNLTFAEITHPDDLNPGVNNFRLVMAPRIKGTDQPTEVKLNKRYRHGVTGEWVTCQLLATGYYDDNGEFLYFLSEVLPVTNLVADAVANDLEAIRAAIANGEIVLHYQPIVSLANGQLVGYEALARWQHPGEGLLMPRRFIPTLAMGGYIHELCHFAIEQVGRDQQNTDKWLSFNVSPLTLKRTDWPEVAKKIHSTSHLEVTEREQVLTVGKERLRTQQKRGVKVAIDDFGIGYSNFSAFDWADFLKIDLSLTKDIETKPTAWAKCQAIISLAHACDLEVVAEGVETDGQKLLLRQLQCDYGQGFLFGEAKPLPSIAGSTPGRGQI